MVKSKGKTKRANNRGKYVSQWSSDGLEMPDGGLVCQKYQVIERHTGKRNLKMTVKEI
jgi:hypothetical protein